MTEHDEPDQDLWVGSIIRSGIDSRVWVVGLADGDTYSGAMQASTSLRRAKSYATEACARSGIDVEFVRTESGEWGVYEVPR